MIISIKGIIIPGCHISYLKKKKEQRIICILLYLSEEPTFIIITTTVNEILQIPSEMSDLYYVLY